MLGAIKYVTNRINGQKWVLHDDLGMAFEEKIYQILVKQLGKYMDGRVRVHTTPRSRDDGKDIIIDSSIPLVGLMNYSFGMRGKERIKILIECKSTNATQVRMEKIIGNVARIKESDADYFVLVTNSCVTPYTHYRMYEDLQQYGIELILIDQYLLATHLQDLGEAIGKYTFLNIQPAIEAEYQSLQSMENGYKSYELYLSFRNYTDKHHHLRLSLLTDRNWAISHDAFETILEPFGGHAKKIIVTREYSDGINDLIFKIKLGERESQFHIHGEDLAQRVEPPFIGKERLQLLDSLVEAIQHKSIIFLHGDAGMGKTRLVQEAFKVLDGRNLVFGFFSLGRGEVMPKIVDFLKKKSFQPKSSQRIDKVIGRCSNSYLHAVIIMDDLHNADKVLLDEIRLLAEGHDAPVTLLLCGRTDYSAGNIDYFSFAQWAIESDCITSYELSPLQPEDTKNIIRQLISYVPEYVLERLTQLCQNNPLYIVQYIEYMLEMDLLTLNSRNTIGINNIESFSAQNYMPSDIEDIYSARWKNLAALPQGELMQQTMLICAVTHGALPGEQIVGMLGNDMQLLQELTSRSFLKMDNQGDYTFLHESIYLFVDKILKQSQKLQRQISREMQKFPLIFENITHLDKGMLALWADDYGAAYKWFSPAFSELKRLDNHSSFNVDTSIYNYLYFMYELLQESKMPDTETMCKIILTRIYIALHYYTPQTAVNECEYAIQLISKGRLSGNEQLYFSLLEHQAHSYINAGNLTNGELVLKKLQATWLLHPDKFSLDTTFDMCDKFCNIYIKQNCYDLAVSYNQLSLQQAENKNDDNLRALAYISNAKIHFYISPAEALLHIQKADALLCKGISERIHCHNQITALIHACIYTPAPDWTDIYQRAGIMLKTAVDNSYGTSVIRAYMLLALSHFMEHTKMNTQCVDYISKGIDASIRFGIGTYTWQFYNLLAILYLRNGYDKSEVMKIFNTVYAILERQALLYLGRCDFCYGNMLAISNIGYFWQSDVMETNFYSKMAAISYSGNAPTCDFNCSKPSCGYLCKDTSDYLKQQYQLSKERKVLFSPSNIVYPLRDAQTEYFLIIS